MTTTLDTKALALACTLADTSDEALLRTYAALTHREHEARRDRYNAHPRRATADSEPYDEARASWRSIRDQRDVVEAEVLRRMGGTR